MGGSAEPPIRFAPKGTAVAGFQEAATTVLA
jgi:hypothetical protein